MIHVKALYNSRKSNGDVSDWACDVCGKIGAAYIELLTTLPEYGREQHETYICGGCLSDWQRLINESILKDVMDSVERRRRRESNV
jgi:hypothetical protein